MVNKEEIDNMLSQGYLLWRKTGDNIEGEVGVVN